MLRSSMNSSVLPPGPLKRNSLINTSLVVNAGGGVGVGKGVGVATSLVIRPPNEGALVLDEFVVPDELVMLPPIANSASSEGVPIGVWACTRMSQGRGKRRRAHNMIRVRQATTPPRRRRLRWEREKEVLGLNLGICMEARRIQTKNYKQSRRGASFCCDDDYMNELNDLGRIGKVRESLVERKKRDPDQNFWTFS